MAGPGKKTLEEVKRAWKSADCVCFDVDSTVSKEEGIDELARFLSVGEEVKRLTSQAMQGQQSFRTSLRRRLDIMKPSRSSVQKFLDTHPVCLTPGVDRLVSALQDKGVAVYLVSGGFTSLIAPLAELLSIPLANVYANELLFNDDGSYAGFNESCPTSDDDGKARVVEALKRDHGYKVIVHVGDGVTDADACPPADAFIGFGGIQVRGEVEKRASWFVLNFEDLIREL